MSEFTKWIMSVLAVAIIGFTVDLFLSDVKTAKIVRVATAAITLLVLVTPLPSLISDGEINLENFTFIYKTETDTKYAEYIAGQKRAVLASSLKRSLAARGLKNAAVKVMAQRIASIAARYKGVRFFKMTFRSMRTKPMPARQA